jgi:NHL repeat
VTNTDRPHTAISKLRLTVIASLLLTFAMIPGMTGNAQAARSRPGAFPRIPLRFNAHGHHVRSFVVHSIHGARALVSTTAATGQRPVQRFDTGQALPVNPTAVFFTAQPGYGNPSSQPYNYGSDYSLNSAGPASSPAGGGGGGAITSADFLGDGRQETVSAERCNGPDICLMLRRADGSYSSWWDSGLLLDTVDGNATDRIVVSSADFTGGGHPQLAMAYETDGYYVSLATFKVDASAGQAQPFTQTAVTSVGQLLVSTETGNVRQSFGITRGDFAGDGLQEVAVAYDAPYPNYPSNSQAQVSIYGLQTNQLTAEGGFALPTDPYYLSVAAGHVLRGPASGRADDVVLATGYPASQVVNVVSFTDSGGSFSVNQFFDYTTNSTGQYKYNLADANIQVATGDLQGNGSDDVVVAQTGDENQGTNEDYAPIEMMTLTSSPVDSRLSVVHSTAFCCTTGPSFSGQFSVAVSHIQPIDPNAQFSSIKPQIVVAADVTNTTFSSCPYLDCLEVMTYPADFQGPGLPWGQLNLQFFPLANQDQSTYLPQNDEASRTAFALTDPTGASLTLGPPTQQIVNGVQTPMVILRAPPIHFDQFGSTPYDVNSCFNLSPFLSCGFGSSFSDSQQSTFTTDVTQTDSWAASATVSGGVSYAGFDVEASLSGRYGKNFSQENNSTVNTQVTVQVNANINDYVFYRRTDYAVLEYPIYGVGNTTPGHPNAYIAVITGVDTSYAFENTSPGSTVAPLLDNVHQQGNLLSYPYYFPSGSAEPSNSIDDNPEVTTAPTGGAATSTPFPSISIGPTGSASGQDVFANQTGQTISNTQTEGYTVTASVGYEQEGVPIKAKVEGSYAYDASNFQSQTSSFGTTMQLNWNTGSLNKTIVGTNYSMRPFLYWNRLGALVLDWEVQLPTSNNGVDTFWQQMYGHRPDPALDLPDLLDPQKGYGIPPGGLQYLDPEMTFTPAAPTPSTTLGVITPIHNYSLMNEAPWPGVRFFLGDPAAGGIYIGTGTSGCFALGDCLPSQYTALTRTSWTLPSGLGGRDIRIYASVDSSNAYSEVHYTNNTGWGNVHVYGNLAPTADVWLAGSDISPSTLNPTPGSTITLRATVHSGSTTSPVQVRFWNGNPATNGAIIGLTTVSGLKAGQPVTTILVPWTVPNTPGQYTIYVQLLPLYNYDTNMLNNTTSTTLTSPALFVANTAGNSVTAYGQGSSGNIRPIASLSGAATGLTQPRGLVIDSYGHIYVADGGNSSITEYSEGSTGNAAPLKILYGTATGLSAPQGLALDASGDLFVANLGTSSITEYKPGASGNVAPIATISGTATGLSQPQGLTLDGSGHLYVANGANSSITEYASNANGNVAPIAKIAGASTGLSAPRGLLFDSSGHLRAANSGNSTITSYGAGANGNVAPIVTVGGSGTGLNGPGGMDINGSGQIAVANTNGNSVSLFSPAATGNAAPIATISGSVTGLNGPAYLAFTPPPAVTTGDATAIMRTRATVTGVVTPDGSATTWHFGYKQKGSTNWSRSRASFAGSGGSDVGVRATLRHLHPATTYRYRLVATNPGGQAIGDTLTFKTKA